MKMMKNDKNGFRFSTAGLLLGGALLAGMVAPPVTAQESQSMTPKKQVRVGRDPFRKYEPPRQSTKKMSGQVVPPSIQERIERYKAQKAAAMNARMTAPKPTVALLLSELQVVGISRTPRGYAAIVEATPIKLSYVIYPGESFYDGQLVAIEENRLIFRHEIVYADGRRERSVMVKPLRQASSVNAMTTSKSTTPDATSNDAVATVKP
jgi:hypothetical protein